MDIFKELKKGVDFYTDVEHYIDNPYKIVSVLLVDYCENHCHRCFSDFILRLKLGEEIYNVYASFDCNSYSFEFLWDWYEGEDTIQILDLKSIYDVFDDKVDGAEKKES